MARTTAHRDRQLCGILLLLFVFFLGVVPAGAQVTFSNIGGPFQSDIGIDFNQKTGALTTSVNFLDNAQQNNLNNLAGVDLSGNHAAFAPAFTGSNDELKLAVARTVVAGRGCPTSAVPAGTVFTSQGKPAAGQPTQVVMVAHDGSGFVSVGLTNGVITDSAPVRGALYFDYQCIFNAGGVNHLFVVTADPAANNPTLGGHVWDIPVISGTPGSLQFGTPRHIAFLTKPGSSAPAHLEGLILVPNDSAKYGPWAGKLITGDEDRVQPGATTILNGPNPKIYAIDPATGACSQNSSASNSASCPGTFAVTGPLPHPEDFDFIDGDFYGIAFNNHNATGQGKILRASLLDFNANNGDILVTQEYPIDQTNINSPLDAGANSGLYQFRWDALNNRFVSTLLTRANPGSCPGANCFFQWEHVTFVPPAPPAQLRVVKTPDNGTFTQGAQVTFTIVVSNPAAAGAGTATNVQLSDQLPTNGGLTWTSVTTTQGSCSISATYLLTCSLGSIAPQGSVTITVKSPLVTPNAACASQPNPAANATADGGLKATDSGSLSCTPPTATTTARITGGGSIFATVNGTPGVRVTHGFQLRCDANDQRQSLEINWDGGNNFHLDKLINSVTCFDDLATTPPPPPNTVVDTYAGTTLFNGKPGYHGFGYAVGSGTCNKEPATIYFILVDAGEPGTADIAEYHIVSTGCTLDAGPALIDKGNHQFHKN